MDGLSKDLFSRTGLTSQQDVYKRQMEKASAAYQQQKKEATFVGRQYSFDTIVGKSPAIQAAIALAQKVSATEVPVLLTGETGTGKEVFAQSIHCLLYTSCVPWFARNATWNIISRAMVNT